VQSKEDNAEQLATQGTQVEERNQNKTKQRKIK
jgi:hypothetical protein